MSEISSSESRDDCISVNISVHKDSLIALLSDAVEKYSLKISDIRLLKSGETVNLYLLTYNPYNTNLGSVSKPVKMSTKKYLDDYHFAIYTHIGGMRGKLFIPRLGIVFSEWLWEINSSKYSLDKDSSDLKNHWSLVFDKCEQCEICRPTHERIGKLFGNDENNIPGNTKVGYKGPVLLAEDISKLPEEFVYYGTEENYYSLIHNRDLSEFETVNSLTVKQ